MAFENKTVKATCLCGSAQHEITLPISDFPLKGDFCHCHSCRHMTGTLCLTNANMPASYEPPPELISQLTPFQFSRRLTQYFCSTCGSQMLAFCWQDADDHSKGFRWDIMSGTLEQADGVVKLSAHEFVADTIDGGFSDFLPSIDGDTVPRWALKHGNSEQLPLYWYSPERPDIKPSPTDKLHAHCKCGGVNFYIARPSERSKNAQCSWPDVLIPYHSNEPRPGSSAWWLRDNGAKFLGGVCSCDSCRLDTGMEWIQWAFIPTIDITLDAEGKSPFSVPFGTLKGYRSTHNPSDTSQDVTRYFCNTCGASVFYTAEDRDGLVDVAVGLLDAPEGARAESWLEWRTERLSYREDSITRASDLTLAVERGLEEFGKRKQK